MKIIIYDEQYRTKLHGGWSEWTSSIYSIFKRKYDTEVISLRDTLLNNRFFLFPYLREFLIYPVYYLFTKKRLIWDKFLFNSTFTNVFSWPPEKSILIVHCLFSLQLKKINKVYSSIFRRVIILFIGELCSFYERVSIQRFNLVICPRDDIKNFIINDLRIKTKCLLLPQFASSLTFFKINEVEKIYDIIFIWRNSKPKGFLDLIDFAIRYPQMKICVCGNCGDKKYNHIKNIIFLWRVQKNILNEVLNKSKVLFMPSYSETWPLVTIESIMSWTPVISSVEWWWVFIKDWINWFIYEQYDSRKVYECFKKITTDYSFFSDNALKVAKEFEIEKIVLELEKIMANT